MNQDTTKDVLNYDGQNVPKLTTGLNVLTILTFRIMYNKGKAFSIGYKDAVFDSSFYLSPCGKSSFYCFFC